jgi:hypothetical protein
MQNDFTKAMGLASTSGSINLLLDILLWSFGLFRVLTFGLVYVPVQVVV